MSIQLILDACNNIPEFLSKNYASIIGSDLRIHTNLSTKNKALEAILLQFSDS